VQRRLHAQKLNRRNKSRGV